MLVTLSIFNPAKISRDNYRLYVALDYLCYLGFGAHALFVPLFFWIGIPELAIFNIFSVLLWVLAYFLNRAAHHREAIIITIVESVVHAALATYFLGWESGFHYYFLPVILFLFINHRQNIFIIIFEAILIFSAYVGLLIYTHQVDYVSLAPTTVVNSLQYINIAVNFSAFGILGYFFRIASTQAEQQMELLATTDTLTGLFNRRKMHESIDQEVVRYQRDKKSFLLVITDIDHFKKFNDNYGHDCGDYVLQQVSTLMKESLRQQDVVARWGGEEFLIMLPETELEGGVQAIEKLRETLANTVYQYEDNTFSVTMTFGVTAYDGSCDVEACIKHADEVLYAGKRGGRNRVVSTLIS
ncbi:MAG: GGDEF domain-containing protein [Sulfuriflexus sp.]|nr:GGDEF domain-containing protein [Sulfuriflexus sp.]